MGANTRSDRGSNGNSKKKGRERGLEKAARQLLMRKGGKRADANPHGEGRRGTGENEGDGRLKQDHDGMGNGGNKDQGGGEAGKDGYTAVALL